MIAPFHEMIPNCTKNNRKSSGIVNWINSLLSFNIQCMSCYKLHYIDDKSPIPSYVVGVVDTYSKRRVQLD